MNSTETTEWFKSESFKFQVAEHVAALRRVQGPARDILNLSKQFEYLRFVMDNYPDAVIRYLSQEPQHFARLSEQSTDAAMAYYVNQIAEKIFNYSIMGKILKRILARGWQPGLPEQAGGTNENVLDQLQQLAEQKEDQKGKQR